jgi:hypothetical protein
MAVVLLEGGLSPIPTQMASAELHRGPRGRACQFAHSRMQTPIDPKRNSLLNLDFFASSGTERLEYHQKQPTKITLTIVKHQQSLKFDRLRRSALRRYQFGA